MTYFQKYQIKKRRKYGNIKREYNGTMFDSIKEADYAFYLDCILHKKEIKSWEYHPKVELKVYGQKICDYTLDFKIIHNDKSEELIEVKGFATYSWRLKWKLFEAIWTKEHPEITLTIIR